MKILRIFILNILILIFARNVFSTPIEKNNNIKFLKNEKVNSFDNNFDFEIELVSVDKEVKNFSLKNKNDLPKIEKLYLNLVKKYPEQMKAHSKLVNLYYYENRFDNFITQFQEIIKLSPNDNMNYAFFIAVFIDNNKNKENYIINTLNNLVRKDKRNYINYNLLGYIFIWENNFKESIKSFKQTIQINYNDQVSHTKLSELYYSLGDFENSLKENKILTKIAP
jgi:tetratricopeptide (TPR) repeat protein